MNTSNTIRDREYWEHELELARDAVSREALKVDSEELALAIERRDQAQAVLEFHDNNGHLPRWAQ